MDDWFDEWWPFRRRPLSKILREMDRAFEEVFKELHESMPKDLFKERKLPDGSVVRSFGPVIYGYSMTVGPDGVPRVRTFGNLKPAPVPTPTESREPFVEVIPSPNIIRVVAEIPGVNKEDIDLRVTENTLIISAQHGERKYYKEVELPDKVDPKNVDASYTNGVLDVVLRKSSGLKGEKVQVK
ncbi:MAG: archaeal heat shock protein Hsp20 [Candidatus Hadarchaeales archaeon]